MKKYSFLQIILTVLSVSCLLISNVITAKQALFPFGITMTCAVFIFPVTYILSDLFSEVYGYKWSRMTCYIGFAMNLLMVLMFELAIRTPAPSYWENQEAFETVLGSSPRILIASFLAYIVGDFANDRLFARMKKAHPDMKGFSARAFLSSVVGEAVDSAIFIPLAFIGTMPLKTLLIMGVTQVSLKLAYEAVILPLTTFFTRKAQMYELEAAA